MLNVKNNRIIVSEIKKTTNNKEENPMAWTDEKKQQVIAKYVEVMEQYETPELKAKHSTAEVASIAEEFSEQPNGVRTILTKAGVYIRKAPTPAASTSGGAKKVNKAEAIQELKNLITSIEGAPVDEAIIDKLTGKAAVYFAEVLQASIGEK